MQGCGRERAVVASDVVLQLVDAPLVTPGKCEVRFACSPYQVGLDMRLRPLRADTGSMAESVQCTRMLPDNQRPAWLHNRNGWRSRRQEATGKATPQI